MANNVPINLRIKFKKVGNLQYISHLDLVRTMHKIVVRTKLPVWYTEGFNPKPKMVFAAPLSTGTESLVEFMDLRLDVEVPLQKAIEAFNSNMTDEMQVLDAYYPTSKLTELKWLAYTITVYSDSLSAATADECNSALSESVIIVDKKTKSGVCEVDIKPMIKSAQTSFEDGALRIDCILSADSASFLNPEYIVKYLRNKCGILTSENLLSESYTVMRNNAYFEDMTEFR